VGQRALNEPPGRVLICEDDASMRVLLEDAMVGAGLEVETADEGRAGLARATAAQPDAIVVDWLMPGLDGISLCSAAREHPELALAHIVLVTGRKEREYAQIATDAGADDVYHKPFDPEELADSVRAGIRRARAARRVIGTTRTDALTGLRDERCFREDLDRLLALAEAMPLTIAVAGCSVPDDTGAVAVGALAGALGAVLGPADTLYRVTSLGEVGFAVIAPDADEPDLLHAALESAARHGGADAGTRIAAMLVDGGGSDDVLRGLADRMQSRFHV
jgi:DNA-binding response OmpR family regulator